MRASKRMEDREKSFWDNERIRWAKWERDQVEMKARQEQFRGESTDVVM